MVFPVQLGGQCNLICWYIVHEYEYMTMVLY